jgi:hypothetical protein
MKRFMHTPPLTTTEVAQSSFSGGYGERQRCLGKIATSAAMAGFVQVVKRSVRRAAGSVA